MMNRRVLNSLQNWSNSFFTRAPTHFAHAGICMRWKSAAASHKYLKDRSIYVGMQMNCRVQVGVLVVESMLV